MLTYLIDTFHHAHFDSHYLNRSNAWLLLQDSNQRFFQYHNWLTYTHFRHTQHT